MKDTNGGVGVKMTRTGLGLRAVNFIFIVAMFAVIGNEDEIDCHSFGFAEKTFGKLCGESLVDAFLETLVAGQGFEDGGGNSTIIGRTGEIAAGGEEGLNTAKGAKQHVDDDFRIAFCPVILFREQIADATLEIFLDNWVALAKISSR